MKQVTWRGFLCCVGCGAIVGGALGFIFASPWHSAVVGILLGVISALYVRNLVLFIACGGALGLILSPRGDATFPVVLGCLVGAIVPLLANVIQPRPEGSPATPPEADSH